MGNDPAGNLRPELKAMISEYDRWWDATSKILDVVNEVRGPLYHYTSMSGLVGILKSQTQWFTSIFHLNDPSELAYGLELAQKALAAERDVGTPAAIAFCDWLEHVLIKAGGEIIGWFVASFSTAPDDLGQWRSYADNGRGVVLGLASSLFAVVKDPSKLTPPEKPLVARVNYNHASQINNVAEVVRRSIDLVDRAEAEISSPDEREYFGRALANSAANALFTYAVTSKHSA